MKHLMMILLLTFTACTATEDRPPGDDASVNSARPDTGATRDATAKPDTGATTSNGDAANPRDEPYISQFKYSLLPAFLGQTPVTFNIDGTISNAGVGIGNIQRLSAEHAQAFEAEHLGADTIAKMHGGWECREIVPAGDMGNADAGPDGGGVASEGSYWFEARIQENGDTVVETQEITLCVLDEDPAVMAIVDALELLRLLYL